MFVELFGFLNRTRNWKNSNQRKSNSNRTRVSGNQSRAFIIWSLGQGKFFKDIVVSCIGIIKSF